MYRIQKAFIIAFVFCLLSSCGERNEASVAEGSRPDNAADQLSNSNNSTDGSTEMSRLINQAYANTNAANLPYQQSLQKANMLAQQASNVQGFQKIELQIKYANHMLNAGRSEEAIRVFEEIIPPLESAEFQNKENIILQLKEALGVAYLRLAEQQNCLADHNPASCIIPITPEGQHQLQTSSRAAIRVFSNILETAPEKDGIRYLLNLAYMTIGEYPDNVPAKWLIAPSRMMPENDFPRFVDIAPQLGLDKDGLSGGVCVDDFNNDGFLDIIASSWGFNDPLTYYQNTGQGGFTDRSASSGLSDIIGGLNLQHADYNNDGYMDFLVLRGAWMGGEGKIPNSLIKNNGDGTFTDVTIESGLYSAFPTQTAAWRDFNLDGHLDLFIGNEGGPGLSFTCELFMNQGDGTFQNVAPNLGININAFVKGVSAGDINNDGYPDIYLSILGGKNLLWLNTSAEGTFGFRDITDYSGVGQPFSSFPCWMFDFNNDGYQDIYVGSYMVRQESASAVFARSLREGGSDIRPWLYRNNGDGTFTDVAIQMGLSEGTVAMGSNYGDIDNDGYEDFYLGTGEPAYSSIVPNKMYLNTGGSAFKDITYSGGFGNIQKGHGVGFGDFDLDGDQDMYTVIGGAFQGDNYYNTFYENPGNRNNYVILRLEGIRSNKAAIGAKVILTINDRGSQRTIYRCINTGSSFGGNSLQAEIGLGQAEEIESMRIIWPYAGRPQNVYFNIPANKIIDIKEGLEEFKATDPPAIDLDS